MNGQRIRERRPSGFCSAQARALSKPRANRERAVTSVDIVSHELRHLVLVKSAELDIKGSIGFSTFQPRFKRRPRRVSLKIRGEFCRDLTSSRLVLLRRPHPVALSSGEPEAVMGMVQAYLRDENGATAIEYCLMATFLSAMCIVGATAVGAKLQLNFFGPLANGFQ
jgi:Flp pilus assembly pilin Flp